MRSKTSTVNNALELTATFALATLQPPKLCIALVTSRVSRHGPGIKTNELDWQGIIGGAE